MSTFVDVGVHESRLDFRTALNSKSASPIPRFETFSCVKPALSAAQQTRRVRNPSRTLRRVGKCMRERMIVATPKTNLAVVSCYCCFLRTGRCRATIISQLSAALRPSAEECAAARQESVHQPRVTHAVQGLESSWEVPLGLHETLFSSEGKGDASRTSEERNARG